jgi:nucleotide-binding universal stress UspA family protein
MATVVVGIDGTEASRPALKWAGEEAKLRGAALRIVHTWSRPYSVSGPNPRNTGFVGAEDSERRLADELVDGELDATGIEQVRIERELVEGAPAEALLHAAQGADMLVIGSSRHRKLGDMALGAVGRECVEHSPCPVVIVRPAMHGG